MKESQMQTALLKELHNHGWFYKASDKFRAGIPDIIGCYKGNFLAIELKVDYNKPSDLQLFELQRVVAEGGYAVVVHYLNKQKLYKMNGKEYKTKKEIIECILRQSLLNTSANAYMTLGTDPTSDSSLSLDLGKPRFQ